MRLSRLVFCLNLIAALFAFDVYAAETIIKGLGAFETESCAVTAEQAFCWGKGKRGALEVHSGFKNIKQIVINNNGKCVLDDARFFCWGSVSNYNLKSLVEPQQIAASYNDICAIDGKLNPKVICSGRFAEVPPLKNPRQIVMGYGYACALHDDGVTCWGTNKWANSVPKDLVGTVKLYATNWYVCAEDNYTRLRCWSDSMLHHTEQINVSYGFAGGRLFCGYLTRNQGSLFFQCLGGGGATSWYNPQLIPSDIWVRPGLGAIGENHMCTSDGASVDCWGADVMGQSYVPKALREYLRNIAAKP